MMYSKIIHYILLCVLFFVGNAYADLNYKVLPAKAIPQEIKVPAGKILVFDFFSYGCPHCAHLNPYLEKWQEKNAAHIVSDVSIVNKKSAYIIFQQVPVSFQPGWAIYSEAFHIANDLHQEKKLRDKIFEIAQNPLLGFGSLEQLRSFFLQHGVPAADFDQVAHSPTLQQQLKQDQDIIRAFKIMEIPVVIVMDGKHAYVISNTTVPKADPTAFVQALSALTAKSPGA